MVPGATRARFSDFANMCKGAVVDRRPRKSAASVHADGVETLAALKREHRDGRGAGTQSNIGPPRVAGRGVGAAGPWQGRSRPRAGKLRHQTIHSAPDTSTVVGR